MQNTSFRFRGGISTIHIITSPTNSFVISKRERREKKKVAKCFGGKILNLTVIANYEILWAALRQKKKKPGPRNKAQRWAEVKLYWFRIRIHLHGSLIKEEKLRRKRKRL